MDQIRTSTRRTAFTRPANTTQYTAGDAMGKGSAALDCILEFPPAYSGAGKSGKIIGARLWKDDNDVVADDFTLLLYQALPSADPDDNAAPSTSFIAIADVGAYIGQILFTSAAIALAAGVTYDNDVIAAGSVNGIPFHTAGDGVIFGILTAADTYTPASAEVFTITLEIQE